MQTLEQTIESDSILGSTTEAKHTWVQFNSFQYQGWDKVADELSISEDEFLNPILAGFHAETVSRQHC